MYTVTSFSWVVFCLLICWTGLSKPSSIQVVIQKIFDPAKVGTQRIELRRDLELALTLPDLGGGSSRTPPPPKVFLHNF